MINEVQTEAFKLGFSEPEKFNSLEMLKVILKENKLKQDEQDAYLLLKEIHDQLGEDVFLFWCNEASKLNKQKHDKTNIASKKVSKEKVSKLRSRTFKRGRG